MQAQCHGDRCQCETTGRGEESAFETFLNAGIDRIHLKFPNVKVKVEPIITANGAKNSAAFFAKWNMCTDYIDYADYPDCGDIMGSLPMQAPQSWNFQNACVRQKA